MENQQDQNNLTNNNQTPQENINPTPQPPVSTTPPLVSQPSIYNNTNLDNTIPPIPTINTSFETPINPKKPIFKSKKFIIPVSIFLVLLIGGLGFYFLYWRNPNVIWSDFLNTSKVGYQQITKSLNASSNQKYAGYNIDGSLSIKDNGGSFSSSLSSKSNGLKTSSNLNLQDSNGKIVGDLITNQSGTSAFPDIYFRLNGSDYLKNQFSVNPSVISKYNNQWILIDHTLIDSSIGSILNSSSIDQKKISIVQADIWKFISSSDALSSKYLFSTDSNSILKVDKKVGFEKINTTEAYHYVVSINNDNLHKYLKELRDQLARSQAGKEIADTTGTQINNIITDDSINNLKSDPNYKYEIWVNSTTHILTSFKYSTNNGLEYTKIDLNWKLGSSTIPLNLEYYLKSTNSVDDLNLSLNLNTTNLKTTIGINYKNTDSINPANNSTISGSIAIQPTNDPVNVTIPNNPLKIEDLLNSLGI